MGGYDVSGDLVGAYYFSVEVKVKSWSYINPLNYAIKTKNKTDGSQLNCSIGISPSRLCPDCTHCLRRS